MQEINLYDLLKHYSRYWLLILCLTVTGFLTGIIYNNLIQTPLYKSSSSMILVNSEPISSTDKPIIINNYLELIKSRRVLDPVISSLKLHQSYDQLAKSVSTNNDKDTEVFTLSIATTDPNTSKQAVDATVKSFEAEVKRLYKTDSIQVVDTASTPATPYNVHKNLQLVLFTAVGFLLALIITFFIYDFRLNTGKEVFPKKTKKKSKTRRYAKKSSSKKK